MFFDEKTERQILHNSTSKLPYNNEKLIKRGPLPLNPNILTPYARKVGGSKKDNGVSTLKPPKLLYSSSMSGGAKPKKSTAWMDLLNKTRKEQGLSLKDAMKYVKEHNLYKK